MRSAIFTRRRLRASYRGFSSDYVLALIDAAAEQDDSSLESYCLHRPRRLRSRMNEKEQ
jgi:hypothetical protein